MGSEQDEQASEVRDAAEPSASAERLVPLASDTPPADVDRDKPTGRSSPVASSGVLSTPRGVPDSVLPGPMSDEIRFEDRGEISRGGMGIIRRVYNKRLHRHEAMKVLDPDAVDGSYTAIRFAEEARIMGQLDHPNIVPVYDLGLNAAGSPVFFTMKLVRGQPFGKFLLELGDGRLTSPHLERVLEILVKICDAISFAHSRGVVHCDIKPSNIMVGSHGQVYVMDWGIALFRGEREGPEDTTFQGPERGTMMGTPWYMAPEQASGDFDLIDVRTDIYGIGGLLYRVLTGRPPHLGEALADVMREARKGRVRAPEDVVKDRKLHPELCRIAMKALAAKPDGRYQCVEDMKRDIEMFLRGDAWLPTQRFEKGMIVINEGEIADQAYIIVEGRCEVYKNVGDRRFSLRTMGPGEVFGETAVFTSEPRTASVVALEDVTVKVVTRELLEMELSRNTWMGTFVRALAGRFRELDEQLTQLRGQAGG